MGSKWRDDRKRGEGEARREMEKGYVDAVWERIREEKSCERDGKASSSVESGIGKYEQLEICGAVWSYFNESVKIGNDAGISGKKTITRLELR